MTVRLPTASRNAAVAAVAALFDGGAGAGTIEVRTGSQPASGNDSASGTLLATFTLADPAFGSPSSGAAAIDATPVLSTTGAAAGTAGWFRGKDSTGASVLDGSVTATGGGGDLTLNTTTVSVGLTVEITGGSLTMPG